VTFEVEIRYLAAVRDETGCRQERVTLPPGATLQDVFQWLNTKYGLSLPNAQVMVVLNGKGWGQLPALQLTKLENGDAILLFPVISGG
jgi:molybdopterin converting factor small subunit